MFPVLSIPGIICDTLVDSYRNRDNARTEFGQKKWICDVVDSVAETLTLVTQEHDALGEMVDDLYDALGYIDKLKSTPEDVEEELRVLWYVLYEYMIRVIEERPDDYPTPENDSPEDEVEGTCYAWHYAAAA